MNTVYRLLNVGEIIRADDEWYHLASGWMLLPLFLAGKDLKDYDSPIRRKIQPNDPANEQILSQLANAK